MLSKIYGMIMEYRYETGELPVYLFVSDGLLDRILPTMIFGADCETLSDDVVVNWEGAKLFGVEVVVVKNRNGFIWVG